MRPAALASLLLLGAAGAGCATAPTPDVNAFAAHSARNSFEVFHRAMPASGLVLPVVHDRQTSAASCGAHALASVINYWRGPGVVTGNSIFAKTPPADLKTGYSLAELRDIAVQHGLLASAVRLTPDDLVGELEAGRPVLVPVLVPAVYVDARTLPGQGVPVIGFMRDLVVARAGQISEWAHMGLVGHYVLVVGYEGDRFAIVEPVRGFRTISAKRLERYRAPYGDAALVFSAPGGPAQATALTEAEN
jgi:hypothetical protein